LYLGGWDWEDHGLKPAQEDKSLQDPISKKKTSEIKVKELQVIIWLNVIKTIRILIKYNSKLKEYNLFRAKVNNMKSKKI
jgi:hypothetical protein